jgi:hypothetical protein
MNIPVSINIGTAVQKQLTQSTDSFIRLPRLTKHSLLPHTATPASLTGICKTKILYC